MSGFHQEPTRRRALITGIGGQDGSYLAELLLDKGYEVHGLVRHSSCDNLWRIRPVLDRLTLHQGDVLDPLSVRSVVEKCRPTEIYHEADQDRVEVSRAAPGYQLAVTAGAVATLLDIVRAFNPSIKVFIPCSATVFGDAPWTQDEHTPLRPLSPYACAKATAYHLARHYRQSYDMFVATAFLFNHDSPRRGPDYLLQRIARGAKLWGDGSEVVDIGHAKEFMEIVWRIMQLDRPDDFCVGTGIPYRIRELQTLRPDPLDMEQETAGLVANTSKLENVGIAPPQLDAADVLQELRSNL